MTTPPGHTVQPPAPPPRRATSPSLRLVLPRHALDACLADWLAPATAAGTAPRHAAVISHAPLHLQHDGTRLLALAGPLQAGPPLRLPAHAHRPLTGPPPPLQRPWPTGLLLLALAGPDDTPPDQPPANMAGQAAPATHTGATPSWDHWLASVAPEHRLASPALQADLLVCWLRADGQVRLRFRPGDGWRALQPPGTGALALAPPDPWLPVQELWLPGAEMLRLRLDDTEGARPAPADTGPAPAAVAPALPAPGGHMLEPDADIEADHHTDRRTDRHTDRYATLAAALGPAALQRWQQACFGLVGAGRAGSVLAHSLLRSGASLRVVDPDTMSPHSLDGDVPPGLDGQPTVLALAQQLRGLARPGAVLDARQLPVASAAAGWLLGGADILVAAADNDAAALWANAWALALLKPLLVVATGLHPHGAEADLRLLPPGGGCLACIGGFSQLAELPAQLAHGGPPPAPPGGARQRGGSLRSWGLVATHAGLRMLEQMVAGQLRQPLFRRLVETADGGLQVHDWAPATTRVACPLCSRLLGAGMAAVRPEVLLAAVQALQAMQASGAAAPPAPRAAR